MADPGIVRNRAKIEATIANARAAADLDVDLGRVAVVVRAPAPRPARSELSDVPAVTPESTAMAKELKRRGFQVRRPDHGVRADAGHRNGRRPHRRRAGFRAELRTSALGQPGLCTRDAPDREQWGVMQFSAGSCRRVGSLGPTGPLTGPAQMWREHSMAAMKPRTGDGPLEATKEGRGIVMRVPLEGGGRLVVELTPDEAAALGDELKNVTS